MGLVMPVQLEGHLGVSGTAAPSCPLQPGHLLSSSAQAVVLFPVDSLTGSCAKKAVHAFSFPSLSLKYDAGAP